MSFAPDWEGYSLTVGVAYDHKHIMGADFEDLVDSLFVYLCGGAKEEGEE